MNTALVKQFFLLFLLSFAAYLIVGYLYDSFAGGGSPDDNDIPTAIVASLIIAFAALLGSRMRQNKTEK